MKNLNTFLFFFSRMSTAVFLLFLLLTVSVCGTLIEQNLESGSYRMVLGDFWYELFSVFGLFNVYETWWFLLILLIVLVSVVSCLWMNGPKYLKELNARPKVPPISSLRRWPICFESSFTRQEIERFLKNHGFRMTHDDSSLYAVRGKFARWGYFLAHGGVVLMMIAGLVSGVLGFRGIMSLAEGQSSDEVVVFDGDERYSVPLPFILKSHGFDMDFFSTGMPKNFQSDVEVVNASLRDIVQVNKPLSVGKYNVYQASFGDAGSDVVFHLRSLKRGQLQESLSGKVYQTLENGEYTVELKELRPHTVSGGISELGNDGPSLDYIVRGPDISPLELRSYLNYPSVIGVGDGEGDFSPVFLGLSLDDSLGWDAVSAVLQAEKVVNNVEGFATFATPLLKNVPEEDRVRKAVETMQAYDVIVSFGIPVLLQLVDWEKKYYTTLQVSYDPGAELFIFSSVLLLLGMFGMIYFRFERVYVVENKGKCIVAGRSSKAGVYLNSMKTLLESGLKK